MATSGSGSRAPLGRWPLRRMVVQGPSMAPALRHGDVLLVWLRQGTRTPRPGRIVVVELPDRPLSVKRLVSVEPEGRVRVEGDNELASTDSRALGPLPAEAVRGRVLGRLWPSPRVL